MTAIIVLIWFSIVLNLVIQTLYVLGYGEITRIHFQHVSIEFWVLFIGVNILQSLEQIKNKLG